MAPTETLAEQHFATLQALMPGELVQAALLTGSTPGGRRADLLGKLATGELKLLVGTHALIEETVEFDRLAVAVVDEQHRFGVNQRRALDRKAPEGVAPHVLHMTATPIPRTLALTAYGDLDVTVLRELPAGRRPIHTHVCATEAERARAYERIREELRAGRQAFVVCPLVEESEALQARAATAEYERLKAGELRDFEVVLLHGQMRPREKQEAMAAFAEGGADVLVATTGDRGRHRRAERLGDAGRGRRALRHQPAPPAARPDRPRAARVAVPAVRAQGVARACGRWPSTATASGSPRSTSSCAARGRCSAPASPACRRSASRACPRTSSCSSARACGRARSSTPTRSSSARARPDRRRAGGRLRRRRLEPIPA